MNITLKKLETWGDFAFKAQVHIDGQIGFEVYHDGGGGCYRYYPFADIPTSASLLNAAHEYAERTVTNGLAGERLDYLIGDLVDNEVAGEDPGYVWEVGDDGILRSFLPSQLEAIC
jgi:hypothetical protein